MQEANQSDSKKHKRKFSNNTQTAETERHEKTRENTQDAEQKHKRKCKHKDILKADEITLKRKSNDNSQPTAKEQKRNHSENTQTVSHIEGDIVTIHQIQAKHYHQALLAPSEPTQETETNPIICNIPDKNIYFVGRKKKIKQINSLLQTHKRYAIVGAGGVGKTQLAMEFAHYFQEKYKIIWCLNANTLMRDYIELAKTLNKESVKFDLPQKILFKDENEKDRSTVDIVKDVLAILQTIPNWLIIIDDVEKEEDIHNLLPQTQSETDSKCIIITSRNQHWQTFNVLPLDIFDRQVSITLLQTITSSELEIPKIEIDREQSDNERKQNNDPENKAALNQLAELLGDLPLALTQAGFYIKRCSIDVNHYIQLFLKNRQLLWNKERRPLNYPWSVRMTWEISLKRLNILCPTAVQFLRSICYLRNDIPFIYAKALVSDSLLYNECIEALTSYSLITVNLARQTLSIHPLLKFVLIANQTETNQILTFDLLFGPIKKAKQMIDDKEKDPSCDKKKVIPDIIYNSLFNHFNAVVFYTEKLPDTDMLKLAELYSDMVKIAIKIKSSSLSRSVCLDDSSRRESFDDTVLRYYQQGLDIYSKIIGESNNETVILLLRMAKYSMQIKPYDNTSAMLSRALNICKNLPHSQLMLAKIYQLICSLRSLQILSPQEIEQVLAINDAGITVCNEVAESREKDLRLFKLLFIRCHLLYLNQCIIEAIKVGENAYKIYIKYPQKLKRDGQFLLLLLARSNKKNKDLVTAAHYYERAFTAFDNEDIIKRLDDDDVIEDCLSSLIEIYTTLNDEDNLIKILEKTITHRSKILHGIELELHCRLKCHGNREILLFINQLSNLYISRKEYPNVLEINLLALWCVDYFNLDKDDFHYRIKYYKNLAACYYALDNQKECDSYTQLIFAIDSQNNCGKCDFVATEHIVYGKILYARGQHDAGLVHFKLGISAFEKCDNDVKEQYYKQILDDAANLCDEHEQFDAAIEFYNKLVSIDSTATFHYRLARCYFVVGNNQLSRKHFKKSVNIEPNALVYIDYGLVLLKSNKFHKAAKVFIKTIGLVNSDSKVVFSQSRRLLLDEQLQQEVTSSESFKVSHYVIVHYWLIQCYHRLDDKENTTLYLEKLKAMAKETPSALTNRLISYLYRAMVKEKRADKYLNRSITIKDSQEESKNVIPIFINQESIKTEAKVPVVTEYNIEAAHQLKRMAKSNLRDKNYDSAHEQLTQSLTICKNISDSQLIQAKIYLLLCQLNLCHGNIPQRYELAITLNDAGIAICDEMPDGIEREIRLFHLLRTRALIFYYKKCFTDTIKYCDSALYIYFRHSQKLKGHERALFLLTADSYKNNKDHAAAANYYELALISYCDDKTMLVDEYNDLRYIILNLIEMYKALNDINFIRTLRTITHKYLDVCRQHDVDLVVHIIELGDFYRESEEEYAKAIALYKYALNLLDLFKFSRKFIHLRMSIYQNIILSYDALRNDKEVDSYAQKISEMDKSINCGECREIAYHHEVYGKILYRRGQYDAGLKELRLCISVIEKCGDDMKEVYDKCYTYILLTTAELCIKYKQLDDAIEFYNKLISISPTSSYYYDLAYCYYRKKDYQSTSKNFKKSLAINPRLLVYVDYGSFLMEINKLHKAIPVFTKAINLGNDGSHIVFYHGIRSRLDEQLRQEVTSSKPFKVSYYLMAHYWLIQCYQKLDDKENAKLFLEKLKALAKKSPSAKTNRLISYLYRSIGSDKRADKYLNRATIIKDNKSKAKGYNPTFFKPENIATGLEAPNADNKIKIEPQSEEKQDNDSKQLLNAKPY